MAVVIPYIALHSYAREDGVNYGRGYVLRLYAHKSECDLFNEDSTNLVQVEQETYTQSH